jgi:hypothetical protein
MLIANVSFGIMVLHPIGWLMMFCVIALEALVGAKLCAGTWYAPRLWRVTAGANLASGIVGMVLSTVLQGGWWLVFWIPWVSRKELAWPAQAGAFMLYYFLAFALSVLVEGAIQSWMHRGLYSARTVWRCTIVANVVSYAVFTGVLYSWSFRIPVS